MTESEYIECYGCFRVAGEECSPLCRGNGMSLEGFVREQDMNAAEEVQPRAEQDEGASP